MPIVLPVRKEVAEIEARIANIRRAVENGFSDASWANARLRELVAEREARTARLDCPQLDSTTVMAYRRQTEKLLASVEPAERKRLIHAWVHNIELEPEKLAVRISYRLPEAVMKGVVAGARNVPNLALVIPFRFKLLRVAA